ncbi:MAG TPA: glycoside hydrolase family 36 protein [Dehalococcoidia bacterium]|nr:glycoside hydrolase family 36 protein [Dehalococcoidia bacterium]
MPESVSSGPGRNGPWLQNGWLRVESRQDDGSLSLVAIATGFRPAERALAAVTLASGEVLAFSRSDYELRPYADALGEGRRLLLTSRRPRAGVTLQREVVLYDHRPYAVTRAGITNERDGPLPLGTFHPFRIPGEGRARLQLASRPEGVRVYRHGWQSWSPTLSLGGADRDVQSSPPVLAPHAPHQQPGRFAPDDVAVLFDPQSGRSLLAGAVTARDWLTRVVADVPGRSLDAVCDADAVPLAPGETAWSERLLVDLSGHPNEQLERYGDALGREMGARVPAATPSGWCSWYYFYTGVTEDDIIRNLRFLEQHRRELPVDTVQIDDGYQADIGDWLTVNDKFPHGMAWLASEIKRAGYTPGIWLAPFLLAESSKTFAGHPGFAVRDGDGAPALAIDNWGRRNYALDGSNPAARAWLTDVFGEICDGWGYDYVKIDFLYAAAIAGRRADPSYSRARAYREALRAVRDAVGDRRFILGCGSLMAPSVGFFDGNRIGPDVAPFWRFAAKADRDAGVVPARTPDDPLSAETAIRNTLTRSWMHGRLWANDPDCVLVRDGRTRLSDDEVRTLATAVGLSGGMMLLSDDFAHVGPARLELASMLVPPLPHSAVPSDLMERDMPERFVLRWQRHGEERLLVALFNVADESRDLTLELPEGAWHVFDVWSRSYAGNLRGAMALPGVGAHACRLLALRPLTPAPCVLATDAHIGAGIIDITAERWEGGSLVADISTAGRRRRSIWVYGAGQQARGARFGRRRADVAALGDGAWRIDLEVDAAGELRVEFE